MVTQQHAGQAPALLDPDTAYAVVHQRVYCPVFFEKLAKDYGIKPSTPEEEVMMLNMAAQLRSAHDQQQKQATARANPLAAAQAHLNNQLTKLGFANQPQQQIVPRLVKQAATQASFDPELAHAILSMQAVAAGVTPESFAAA